MKTHFQKVSFTDECSATVDDGWTSGWCHHVPTRLQRQQRGGGGMFWAGILGNEMVRPFRESDPCKICDVSN